MPQVPVALQLYTVREQLQADYEGTLRAVADVGYRAVEVAGFPDMPAERFKALLNELGLSVASAHIALPLLEGELHSVLEYSSAIGCGYIACPFLPEARRRDAAGYRQVAQALTAAGRRAKERGIQLCYHNHAFEFERFDGQYGIDILLGSADPTLVQWEPDIFWIEKAGVSAADMIRQYHGRCPLIHLKDMTRDADATFAEVGEGSLDFGPIFEAADAGGARWYIVEQDRCQRPPLESVKISLQHLREWNRA